LEKLIKILNLTTSDSDGEALNAIRMANAILAKKDLTWEQVFRARLDEGERIVPRRNEANPFSHSYTDNPFENMFRDDIMDSFREAVAAMSKSPFGQHFDSRKKGDDSQ